MTAGIVWLFAGAVGLDVAPLPGLVVPVGLPLASLAVCPQLALILPLFCRRCGPLHNAHHASRKLHVAHLEQLSLPSHVDTPPLLSGSNPAILPTGHFPMAENCSPPYASKLHLCSAPSQACVSRLCAKPAEPANCQLNDCLLQDVMSSASQEVLAGMRLLVGRRV